MITVESVVESRGGRDGTRGRGRGLAAELSQAGAGRSVSAEMGAWAAPHTCLGRWRSLGQVPHARHSQQQAHLVSCRK